MMQLQKVRLVLNRVLFLPPPHFSFSRRFAYVAAFRFGLLQVLMLYSAISNATAPEVSILNQKSMEKPGNSQRKVVENMIFLFNERMFSNISKSRLANEDSYARHFLFSYFLTFGHLSYP